MNQVPARNLQTGLIAILAAVHAEQTDSEPELNAYVHFDNGTQHQQNKSMSEHMSFPVNPGLYFLAYDLMGEELTQKHVSPNPPEEQSNDIPTRINDIKEEQDLPERVNATDNKVNKIDCRLNSLIIGQYLSFKTHLRDKSTFFTSIGGQGCGETKLRNRLSRGYDVEKFTSNVRYRHVGSDLAVMTLEEHHIGK